MEILGTLLSSFPKISCFRFLWWLLQNKNKNFSESRIVLHGVWKTKALKNEFFWKKNFEEIIFEIVKFFLLRACVSYTIPILPTFFWTVQHSLMVPII